MRRLIAITFTALSLLAVTSPSFARELIDGVVATVNRKPVLRSEWDEAVRFEAFMHQKPLADVAVPERAAALQRLIDRALLNSQIGDEKAVRPSDAEVSGDLAKLREKFSATSDGQWQELLASYGLTESLVAEHLKDEVRVMNFIDVELRPSIRIQDSEVQSYYQSRVIPDLRQSGARQVPLEQVAQNIRELLVQQHMDEMLDAWLHNLRQQSHIQTLVPLPALNAQLSSSGSNSQGGQ
jgi:hypothetical protein